MKHSDIYMLKVNINNNVSNKDIRITADIVLVSTLLTFSKYYTFVFFIVDYTRYFPDELFLT